MHGIQEARALFAKTLVKKMSEFNIRPMDLQNSLDISASSVIHNWRSGKAFPNLDSMYMLSNYFDISIYEFFEQGPLENDPLPVAEDLNHLNEVIKNRMFLIAQLGKSFRGFAMRCNRIMQNRNWKDLPSMNTIIEICCAFELELNVILPGYCNINLINNTDEVESFDHKNI
jgi:transcriptional regulator with XRE-family HTH domain